MMRGLPAFYCLRSIGRRLRKGLRRPCKLTSVVPKEACQLRQSRVVVHPCQMWSEHHKCAVAVLAEQDF